MTIIQHFSHPLINAAGWTLLHSIWQIILIALVWRSVMFVTRDHHAGIRYNITLITLFSVPISFIMTFLKQWDVFKNARQIVSFEFTDASWPLPGDKNLYVLPDNYPSFIENLEIITPWIFWIYLTGLLFLSVKGIMSYLEINYIRKNNTIEIPDEWNDRITVLMNRAGLLKKVNLFLSENITIPLVTGFLKPFILLPLSMFSSLSPSQVEIILLHEFYHIREKDHYINMLQNLLEIIFFYHPAMWWISNRLRSEREKRVDEWIVQETADPVIYARALVQLEESRGSYIKPALAATHSYKLLISRINNFMFMKKTSFNYRQMVTAFIIILAVVVAVIVISPDLQANNKSVSAENTKPTLSLSLPDIPEFSPPEIKKDTSFNLAEDSHIHKKYIIHLDDGTFFSGDSLSMENQEQIREALEEARSALELARKEILEKMNSEEFRQEMEKVREEVQKTLKEVDREIIYKIDTAKIRHEIIIIKKEVEKALEEAGLTEFQQEELRKELEKASKEIRTTLDQEQLQYLQSEEFHEAMEKAQEGIQKALESVDSLIENTVTVKDIRIQIITDDMIKDVMNSLEDSMNNDSLLLQMFDDVKILKMEEFFNSLPSVPGEENINEEELIKKLELLESTI